MEHYQLSAKDLTLANAFTGKDSGRPYLSAVHLTKDRIEASNGSMGVTVHSGIGGSENNAPVLIPSETIKACVKAKDEFVSVVLNGDARLNIGNSETVFTPLDLLFPDLQAVYPKSGTEPSATIFIDATLAATLFKALSTHLKATGCFGPAIVKIEIYGSNQAMRVSARENRIDALLMPCGNK